MEKPQRLDKVLANMGVGSRTEVKKLVRIGAVEIDGKIINDPGLQILPGQQRIAVNGKPLVYRQYVYLMMNKPQGVVSATEDGRDQTVVDLLDASYRIFDVFPVGRLDKDTVGLLLMTNDGQLSHNLLSPKKHIPKTYYAKIRGKVTDQDVRAFAAGVTLEDGYETLPGDLRIIKSDEISQIELTIYEGKFHQVKRMFQAVSKEVIFLKRTAMGRLNLDPTLESGSYRELTEEELNLLKYHQELQKDG